MFGFLRRIFGSAQDRKVHRYRKVVKEINEWENKYQSLSDEELKAKTDEFRERQKSGESLDSLLPEAYAVVKNVCRRLKGSEVHVSGYNQLWDMVPFDVQLIGAIAMHDGSIAEMQTGEGKTLTATLPLYLNALKGEPVHLVTVNDYLAERDCQWVGTILRWLGLKTASLTSSTPPDGRKEIYQTDVVYGTASEFGFDYLRDNSMAFSRHGQVQRGFYFAIVDEIDSILVDEARTPLIISGPAPESRQMYGELKEGVQNLVRKQRDLCNRLATEAKQLLGELSLQEGKLAKQKKDEALLNLWIVSKGTPTHKILKRIKEDPDMREAIDKVDLYYHSEQGKDEKAQVLSQLFMIIDEKSSEYELTDRGIQAWQEIEGEDSSQDFVMLDLGYEYHLIDQDPSLSDEEKINKKIAIQEDDSKRKERSHNLRQMLRAHLLMENDVDYIVQEGKIIIIDENTGRPQPGRRFSDGLHQAIEAKEGVDIQKETQTYATITLQNFFRMYKKLAGMTGTAATEASEFKEIYKLDVLQIPTHKPCVRKDLNDEIYMTEREKYNAIVKEIQEVHAQGRPILMGTESVDISEKISRICRQNHLEHVVLNAKNNAKEAEIIAHAGRKGSITISTNMAGRGTDIKLEPGVQEIGGLHVIGTNRHQSRRIDLQLRGRSGRQGDPGSSKFFISFEDSLLRLFASPRLNAMLKRFRPAEGEPISAGILNKSIATAQKRVEQRNYTIRKHTLQYDDVMNKQRQEIYAFRNDILQGSNIRHLAEELLENACLLGVEKHFTSRSEEGGWNPQKFNEWMISFFPLQFEEGEFDRDELDQEDIIRLSSDKVIQTFREKCEREDLKVKPPEGISLRPGVESPVDGAIRNIMLQEVDRLWQAHLLMMDHLRSDVMLRTVAQKDPLLEFKHEAFRLFDELSYVLKTKIAKNLFRFELIPIDFSQIQQMMKKVHLETGRSLVSELEPPKGSFSPPTGDQTVETDFRSSKIEPISVGPKTGRNDLCPCGSGKKYKKCCGEAHIEKEVLGPLPEG